MLGAVAAGVDEFALLGEDIVVFLEAPSFDERIVNQYELFSVMSEADASRPHALGRRHYAPRRP
jgi:hypothetical protein